MLGTDKEPGIYVRTLNDLFRAIEETSDDMLYSVSMSYLEVRHGSRCTLSTLLSSYAIILVRPLRAAHTHSSWPGGGAGLLEGAWMYSDLC